MKHSLKFLLALLLCCYATITVANIAPIINDFDSVITVSKDGRVDVKEKLTVTSDGKVISRGIFRDFPTVYKLPDGSQYNVKLHVVSVSKDGKKTPYHIKRIRYGIRIYIGDKKVYIKPGRHVYLLHYRAYHLLGYFKNLESPKFSTSH